MPTAINKLNIAGEREVAVPPVHFEFAEIYLPSVSSQNLAKQWIFTNLSHRYYFANDVITLKQREYVACTKVGFEDPKELSFFLMACPYL